MTSHSPIADRRAELARRIEAGEYPTLIEAVFGPLERLMGRILRRRQALGLWVSCLVVAALALAMGLGLALALGEVAPFQKAVAAMTSTAAMGACTVIASHLLTGMLLDSVRQDILPAVERGEDLDVIQDFLEETFDLRRQAVFVAVVGPMVWLLLFASFEEVRAVIPAAASVGLVTLVACLEASLALYYVVPVIGFLSRLGHFHLRLFPASPRDSQVIVNLQHTATEALYVFATLFVLMLVTASRLELLASRTVRLSLVLMTWGPLLVVFVGAQRTFTRIITRAKYHYLAGIQAHIMEVQRRDPVPTSESLAVLGELMDYHERIRQSSNSAIDLRSSLNFINALLLPLVAFLLANWDRVITFVERSGGSG